MNFTDSWRAANPNAEEGYTYHEFLGDRYKPKGKDDETQIDFMFYSQSPGWDLVSSSVIKDTRSDQPNLYPSDHYQLMSVFNFQPSGSTTDDRDYSSNSKWKCR